MSDFPVMPDFLGGLERELRAAAAAGTAPAAPAAPPRRRALPRVAAGFTVVAALTALLVLAIGPGGRPATPAFAGPLILREPTVAIPERFRTLGLIAIFAQRVNELGDRAARESLSAWRSSERRIEVQSARAIPAFGGTAYLLGAPGVWCLTAPDPLANQPDIEVSVTCAPAREFARIGMSLMIGRHYVAALPQGVPAPVLERADGTRTALEPDEHGLVVVESLEPGEAVIRTDADGRTRVDHGPPATSAPRRSAG